MRPTNAQIEARLWPGFRQEYRAAQHYHDEPELQRLDGEWNAAAGEIEAEAEAMVDAGNEGGPDLDGLDAFGRDSYDDVGGSWT